MNIPIIGQPKVLDWSFTALIECPCKHVVLFQGRPATPTAVSIAQCSCGRQYALARTPYPGPDGQLIVPIAMKEAPRASE